jgi:hypothetical protein
MLANNQPPGSPQPGKIVTDVERYKTQSGQVVERRRIEMTILENNVLRKENCFEVDPPLADNRVPESIADIRECCVCLDLFHKDNVLSCPICGGYFCCRCRACIKMDGNEIPSCAECAKEANAGFICKILKKFWTLGD